MNVDTALLRQFLSDKFNATELDSFLFDYFPPVYNEITPAMRNSHKVQMLLEHCRNQGRYPELLAALERERPGAFRSEDFAPTPQTVSHAQHAPAEPIKRNPRRIFISHAHQDAEFAERLAADLQAHGWDIWMAPDSIRPGEKWVEAINRGLAESGIFIVVITDSAIKSQWVHSETNAAIVMEHEGKIKFIPIELEMVNYPPLWQNYQKLHFHLGYKKELASLFDMLDTDRHDFIEDVNHDAKVTDEGDLLALWDTAHKNIQYYYDNTTLLERYYHQFRGLIDAQDWIIAEEIGKQILDKNASYRDVPDLLAEIRKRLHSQTTVPRIKNDTESKNDWMQDVERGRLSNFKIRRIIDNKRIRSIFALSVVSLVLMLLLSTLPQIRLTDSEVNTRLPSLESSSEPITTKTPTKESENVNNSPSAVGTINSCESTIHIVEDGDTIYRLSLTYGVSVDEISIQNDLSETDTFIIGQEILIPAPDCIIVTPTSMPSRESCEDGELIHIVQPGENLFRIGLRYGFTVDELASYNEIDVFRLEVGQEIEIPCNP